MAESELIEEPTAVFKIPSKQRVQYKVTPETDRLFSLKNIGGQLRELGKMLEGAMNDASDRRWVAFLNGIDMTTEGEITFDVAILPEDHGLTVPAEREKHG